MSETVIVKLTRFEANVTVQFLGDAMRIIRRRPLDQALQEVKAIERVKIKMAEAAMGPTFIEKRRRR